MCFQLKITFIKYSLSALWGQVGSSSLLSVAQLTLSHMGTSFEYSSVCSKEKQVATMNICILASKSFTYIYCLVGGVIFPTDCRREYSTQPTSFLLPLKRRLGNGLAEDLIAES